jgi:hypothetical protein
MVYEFFAGLQVLGLAIGRQAQVGWGHNALYPNLFIVIFGRSTWTHKSTVRGIAKAIAVAFDQSRVYSDRFTPEALLQELERNPTLAIYIDEFGEFLGLAGTKDYMSGIKGDLAELYGCPDLFKTSRSGRNYVARDVFFSIYGATTPEWITNHMREKDILGGLAVRFLFIPETEKTFRYDVPPRVPMSEKNKVLMSLKKVADAAKGTEFTIARDGAYDSFVEWKQALEKEATSDQHEARLSPFYARMQESCLKIGMLLEISEGHKGTIRLAKMEQSIEVMNLLKDYLRRLVVDEFAQDGFTMRMKKLRGLVEKYPGKDRRFYKNYSHMAAREFSDPWESCIAERLIQFDKEEKGFFLRENQ